MRWRGMTRRSLPYLVVAALGFGLAYVVAAFFIYPQRIIPAEGDVPNVMGIRYTEAERRLSRMGLVVTTGESRYHETSPSGVVLGQNPAPGARVGRGQRVVLDVSLGQRRVEVPRLIGLTRAQAELALENAGLDVGEVIEEPSAQPRGQVMASTPAAGERATVASAVDLQVSRGPVAVEVPEVVGQSYPQARNLLAQLALQVGRVTIDSASTLPSNTVVTQDPGAGRSVLPGTGVNLTISGRAVP